MSTEPHAAFRIEHDLLGDREIPAGAYYGVHTARALENFPISGVPIAVHRDLVIALASVKQAAAQTNRELGLLDPVIAGAITDACTEIRGGALHNQFVVDQIQGGAGTSTNMNANEVIANRALEILGHPRGTYTVVHPLEHVNLGQSTNDVYPTAVKVALGFAARALETSLRELAARCVAKSQEFGDMLKLGRTQLQDAVPMTLGQEFGAYAVTIVEDADRIAEAALLIAEINLGGTAIGTGLNTDPEYAARACEHLRTITGLPLSTAGDLVEATSDVGAFVQLSGVTKRAAVKLSKICNDLRLLSSGPRAGFNEINLPPVQAGSSIMPGKVNPVIPEAVNQVAFEVVGNDLTITMAAEAGQLQLNAFEPVMARALLSSLTHLTAAVDVLGERCIAGITANPDRMREAVMGSASLATVLNPLLGYEVATALVAEAIATGASIPDLVRRSRLVDDDVLARIFSPALLSRPHSAVEVARDRR
ncbi:aspartate ammonia-lyase [Gordonia polyisoprenivorans]|uniref:aspartate ammonia-lyase n=1 Tax=Gordonia polyisoprenivorans TaxID=84595 RepID=UPI001AD69822|nr:aspartate ammonia-lyase [Gordonia polyisoprenivorans]QTI68662.1 aspartate ammonia-lyase [Gordonia polyisoprenivorans]